MAPMPALAATLAFATMVFGSLNLAALERFAFRMEAGFIVLRLEMRLQFARSHTNFFLFIHSFPWMIHVMLV